MLLCFFHIQSSTHKTLMYGRLVNFIAFVDLTLVVVFQLTQDLRNSSHSSLWLYCGWQWRFTVFPMLVSEIFGMFCRVPVYVVSSLLFQICCSFVLFYPIHISVTPLSKFNPMSSNATAINTYMKQAFRTESVNLIYY